MDRYLDAMETVYQTIMSFDYPNAISLGLRGRSDAARGMVERTRGDLTTALRAGRLEKRMKELDMDDEQPLYVVNPMDKLGKLNPDIIINIAASPFHYDQAEIRKDVLIRNAKKFKLPVFYVNHVGAQTELLFDGGSMVVDCKGNVFDEQQGGIYSRAPWPQVRGMLLDESNSARSSSFCKNCYLLNDGWSSRM